MPTGEAQSVSIFPTQINVPHLSLYISVSIQSNGSPEGEAALETAPQEIIDLLQTWSGRIADVNGQVYGTTLAPITPTDPDPLPDPPEDPPVAPPE